MVMYHINVLEKLVAENKNWIYLINRLTISEVIVRYYKKIQRFYFKVIFAYFNQS